MTDVKIEVDNLSFCYEKEIKVLECIGFKVQENESIGIIGANGTGKSTLMKALVGIHLSFEGSILINQIPMEKRNLKEIRRLVGFVFQDSENQLFMSTVKQDIGFAPMNYGYSKEEVEQSVEKVLEKLNIQHLKEKSIYKLSGGEKKIVSIGTILSMDPEIILMDEPSIALDPKNRRNLIHILNELPQIKIIASHDLDLIMETCNRTILMSKGTIIKDGNTMEILQDQKLLETYGLELPLLLQGTRNIEQ